MNRFQFVYEHARRHGVKRLCHILGLARCSYYHWLASAPKRAAREARPRHSADGMLSPAVYEQ